MFFVDGIFCVRLRIPEWALPVSTISTTSDPFKILDWLPLRQIKILTVEFQLQANFIKVVKFMSRIVSLQEVSMRIRV